MKTDLPPMPGWLDIPQGDRALAMATQYQFQQTERIAPEKLRALQLEALRRLLAHATQQVPWYRERLGPGFRLESWAQWQALPVLTRQQVQEAGDTLVAARLPREHGGTSEVRSSGSTGRPVCVRISERSHYFWNANTLRDHLWHRRDLHARLAVIKHTAPGENLLPGKRAESWGRATSAIHGSGPSHSLSSAVPVDDQFRWLLGIRLDYLLTYPSLVLELARLNDAAGRPLRFRGLSTLGEMLLPHQRAAGEASFGTRVLDMYSAQEIGYMALQCPRHNHYHVTAETCLVEILDEDNRPCAPGQTGRVVVTPLHNYAQPLVRYAIGDHAVPGEPCDCGIRLPVISRLLGRTRNLVVLPDGSKAWPAYQPTKLMALWPGAQFQVAQVARDVLELRVAGVAAMQPADEDAARGYVSQALPGFRIDIRRVDGIPRSKSGKYEEFICELPDA